MHIKADVVVFVAVLVLSFIVGSYVAASHSASETSEITVEESAILADSPSAGSDASGPSDAGDVMGDLEPEGAVTANISTGDPKRGRDLAMRLCSGCHALPPATDSPVPKAPNFADLAGRWPVDSLAEAFAEGIVVGHGDHVQMPEFSFDPQEIEDLLAYLETLS